MKSTIKSKLWVLTLLFSVGLATNVSSQNFEDRGQAIVDNIANQSSTNPKSAFMFASAKFAKGQITAARSQVDAALNNLSNDDPAFQLWGAMDCYLRWKDDFGNILANKMRDKMVNSPHYGNHNTQNKHMMMASARYLASQTWPNANFASGYSSSDPTGKLTLLEKADYYVHQGEREHNSPTYYNFHYGPFRSVADFVTNAEMKNKTSLAAEWMLVAAAGEWMQGHWPVSSQRVYLQIFYAGQNEYQNKNGKALLWLYFGGPTPKAYNGSFAHLMPAILSSYRLPSIIADVANARSNTFIHKEAHGWPVESFSTSYITPEYSLYSQHEEKLDSWPVWLNQMQRWAVVWKNNTTRNSFFVLHPMSTKVQDLGATKYGQVLQHEGTLVGVYNIPSNDPNPHLKGYVPTNYTAFIDNSGSGRIYLHYGNVMIALHLTEGFTWDDGTEKFTKGAGKIGMVVEVADPNDYSGSSASQQLANFKNAVDPKFNNISFSTSGNPRLTYTSVAGVTLETKYREYDKINGSTVNYSLSSWPLLDDPRIHQDYMGDILTVNHNGATRTYDFGNWMVNGGGGTGGGSSDVLQAENATVSGGSVVENINSGFNGTDYVNFNNSGGFVEWSNVDGGAGGNAQLTFRYALGNSDRTGELVINGESQSFTTPGTGSWTTYQTVTVTASLSAGATNTIRLASTGQDLGNIDELRVEAASAPDDTTPPLPPTSLVATAGDGTVSLDWSDNSEADLLGYHVYRSTSQTGSYSRISPSLLSSSAYTDNTASNGTAYYYVVTAEDTAGNESDYSSQASATPSGGGTTTTQTLQAENASVGGGSVIESDNLGFNGTGYVNFNSSGGFVEWSNVDGGAGGSAELTFRYALGNSDRTGELVINGVSQSFTTTGTGAWTTYQTVVVVTTLNTGTNNTIRLVSNGQDLGNIDEVVVEVEGQDSGVVSTYLEAESGILNAPMQMANDASASAGQYVWVPNGSGNDGPGYVELSFTVPTTGDYSLWGKVIAPSGADNSFYVAVDGGTDYYWSISGDPTTWTWDEINTYTLNAGTHTVRIKQREDGTKLDQLWITNEAGSTPGTRVAASSIKQASSPEELPANRLLKLYPNPSTDKAYLDLPSYGTGTLQVYHPDGRLLHTQELTGGNQEEVDTKSFGGGLYILKVQLDANRVYRERLLIER